MLTFAHVTQTAAHSRNIIQHEDSIPDSEKELEEVVVTSSKTGLPIGQASRLVTVISTKEIERRPAQSIQDLLKSVAGLDIRQRGSNGVLAGISVRGGTFEQTTILLNGANFSNPQTAHYSLDIPVNLSDIERIEIIEGPSSLLFGASAFSGGVNIITKKDKKSNASFRAQAGTHRLFGGEIRGAWKTVSSVSSLSVGYDQSEGYIANSDYKLFNAFWQSRWNTGNSKVDFSFGYNDKKYGANTFYSPQYPNQYDKTRSLIASVRGKTDGKIKFTPQLYWSRHFDEFHLYRPGTPDIPDWYTAPNSHISDVFGFNLNSQYNWSLGIFNFGGELRNEVIRSSNLGKPIENPDDKYTKKDNRTNISYFTKQTFLLNKFSLSLGILANYNTFFDEDFSFYPSMNASYWLTDDLKTFASWNTATRMPTFTDLYYTGQTHKGNSDAEPEKSSSFEFGFKYNPGIFSANLVGFYLKGKDMIDWVKKNSEDKWETQNLTAIERVGAEANLMFDFRFCNLRLGYMYMHQSKDISDWISNYVLDYLRHKFTTGLAHPIYKGFSADWQFRWQDRAGTYTQYIGTAKAEEVPYPSFALLDLKLNYKYGNFDFFASFQNLFNQKYYDLGNIPQPGFWLISGVKFKI